MQHVVVTGGAGYIGSVVAHVLVTAGYQVSIVDHAPQEQLPAVLRDKVTYLSCDIAHVVVAQFFLQNKIHAVIHLAASIEVGESVVNPERYYDNNLCKTMQLLRFMRDANVPVIIAASSSAVYGSPHCDAHGVPLPFREDDLCHPCSPYGRTKLAMEWVLRDYETAYGIQYGILRFCNVAGAVPEIGLGERHVPETHLIPCIMHAIAQGRTPLLFGADHPTPDGSCIRDYVHVLDVAQAHLLLLEYLLAGGASTTCTIGSGHGSSVLEVIAAINTVMGTSCLPVTHPRRTGDPARIVADITRAQSLLGWQPQHSSLDEIVKSAAHFYYART